MAGESKQIYQLTTKEFDGNVLVPFDAPNTDPSTQAQKPYVSGKASGDAVADFIANTEEYATDLDTEAKTITGAINELHAINGYSYDAYDDTATYAVGDLCIYNNALYKCTTAITTAEAWNVSHWSQTSIADEISELKSENIQEYNTLTSSHLNDDMLYSRNGRLVTIACQTTLKTAINANDTLVLYSIGTASNKPQTLNPSTTFISGGKVGMVRIDHSTGDITLYNQSGSNLAISSAINFTITYYAQG